MSITSAAKYLARSAFGIGLSIGLMLTVTCSLFTATAAANMAPPCDGSMNVPPGTQAWIDLQCQVRQATFGDQLDPGLAYKFEAAINKNGTFAGLTWQSEAVTLTIVHAVEAELKTVAAELYDAGAEVYSVFGKLGGPAGKIAVSGIAMKGVTEDTGWMFVVASTLTTTQLDVFSAASRLAGGIRVVNSTTGVSMPLDDLTYPTPLSAHSTDLSTLYCCNSIVTGGDVDPACLAQAQARYEIAMQAAIASMSACVATAAKTFAICMAAALAGSIWFGVGGLLVALACVAILAVELDGCSDQYEIAANAARQNLRLDFEACGLIIYEI